MMFSDITHKNDHYVEPRNSLRHETLLVFRKLTALCFGDEGGERCQRLLYDVGERTSAGRFLTGPNAWQSVQLQ